MKTKPILAIILSVIMLIGVLPTCIFASNYTVTLYCGPEGEGDPVTLTKVAGETLSLAHLRADITAQYGLQPKGGNSDQRVFIMWAQGYDSATSRGTGNTYFDKYDVDADITLYAIWGYPIMFNADGGRYADGSTRKLEYVANYANWNGEATDPKSMYRYNMPDWNGDVPVKEGARRVGNGAGPDGKGYAYGLVRADGKTVFTWEGYGENLTIPPVGGAMAWSDFHCVSADDSDNPYGIAFPEFYAIWEPMVTYDPNGGKGDSYGEYLTWDWKMWTYEYYTIDANSFTCKGAEFTGWNTEPDGSGRSYAAGRRITNTPGKDSEPFTLYAQWRYDHEHSYSSVTTDSTCGNEGKIAYTCTVCGYNYSESIAATGEHNYESVTAEPTCVTEGTTVYTCTVCGDSYEEAIPATGMHGYGEWTEVIESTYFEEGREERTCSVCGATEERAVPVKEYVNRFKDVSDTAWYADEVAYCVKKGYMSGMSETVFSPSTPITREQFVLILANMAGVDTEEYKYTDSGMSDVPTGYWYSGAIAWAVEKGYVKGISEGVFGRGQAITRSQLARLLYLYAETLGVDMTVDKDYLADFTDKAKVRSWAYDNVQWAVKVGLISGVSEFVLSPNTTATRAQCARMIMIFDELL